MKDHSNYHIQSKDKIRHDANELFDFHLAGVEGVEGFIDSVSTKFVLQKHISATNEFKDTNKIM